MLETEGLLADPNDVVIVAARRAWKTYQDRHVYICQPNRSFRNVKRIGFYSRGNIYPLVPLILDKQDDVIFERSAHDGPLGELVDQILDADDSRTGQRHMVFFLSAPDSDDTLDLGQNIPNNKKSRTGTWMLPVKVPITTAPNCIQMRTQAKTIEEPLIVSVDVTESVIGPVLVPCIRNFGRLERDVL